MGKNEDVSVKVLVEIYDVQSHTFDDIMKLFEVLKKAIQSSINIVLKGIKLSEMRFISEGIRNVSPSRSMSQEVSYKSPGRDADVVRRLDAAIF